MASKSLLTLLAIPALGAALGATAAVSCTVQYGDLAFRCNPAQEQNCPKGYYCCSDDPSPQFHGTANGNSVSGMCVKEGAVGPGAGLPELPKCPVPCDPSASDDEIAAVCGGAQCCQTAEVTERDCVLDPDTNMWRPVTGADVQKGLSNWAPGTHDTHQDPSGIVCAALSGGQGTSAFWDCLEAIGSANARGFCMGMCPPENPSVNPNYRSPCDCLNNPSDPFCL